MRRFWIALAPCSIIVLLAACSSMQQPVTRSDGAAPAGGYPPRPSTALGFVDHSVGQEEVSIQAMSLVGVRYRWGGNTPNSGFDCSGLVRYVLARSAAVNLPRTTAEMSLRGRPIQPDKIAPGDLIFFNTSGRPHSHVGIYVGNMRFVNAPSTGGTVRIDYVTNPYWAKRLDAIRRVAPVRGASKEPFEAPTLLTAPLAPSMQRTEPTIAARGQAPVPVAMPITPAAAGAATPATSQVGGSDRYGADTPLATPAQAAAANDPIARFATGNF